MPRSEIRQAGVGISSAVIGDGHFKGLDRANQHLEALFERWDNRLTWPVNISEKYVGGALSVILNFDRPSRWDGGEIEVPTCSADEHVSPPHLLHSTIGIENAEIGVGGGSHDGRNDCVFVQVVEHVEGVEVVASSPWEDFKRDVEVFYPITGCYYSFARGFKTIPAITRSESEVAVLRATVDADNLPGQMVEGGPKVVDSIAYYEGEFLGRIAHKEDFNDRLVSLGVVLDRESVRLCGDVCSKFGLKLADVMIGPFDL